MDERGRRLLMRVQYDGTDFAGFQRQKSSRTVQSALEACLEELLGHPVTVRAAGRTDAGVHARGQAVSFVTAATIPTEKIHLGLNPMLPRDVVAGECREVDIRFDPLKDALWKTYCYRFWRGPGQDVFWSRYSLPYDRDLDFELMESEAAILVGKHDFAGFRAKGSSALTTVREVRQALWRRIVTPRGELWEFYVSADGFLYKMVRLIAGMLLDVGRGHFPPGQAGEILSGRAHHRATCLPGVGLCLEEVRFS